MKPIQALVAAVIGVAVFAVIEIASRQLNVFSAMTPEVWMDALAYALAAVIATWVLAPLIRRPKANLVVSSLVFFILYVIFTGVVGGAVGLVGEGAWNNVSQLRGAFVLVPVNLLLTVFLELWFVAVPAFLVGSFLIVWINRRV